MADAVAIGSESDLGAIDRADWDWDRYASDLRVPLSRLEVGRALVASLTGAAAARGLPWHIVFRKGYVALQRSGGYNVALVDVYWNAPPRLAVKIPRDPQSLGLANPYPKLATSWRLGDKEWGWHVPSEEAIPDVGVALDMASPFHPASGPCAIPRLPDEAAT